MNHEILLYICIYYSKNKVIKRIGRVGFFVKMPMILGLSGLDTGDENQRVNKKTTVPYRALVTLIWEVKDA